MIAHYEKITADGDASSFRCRRYDAPSFTTPWHFHPEWELTLIVESRGQRFVGDRIAPFEPGDLVLLGPNLPHCWLNFPRERAPAAARRPTAGGQRGRSGEGAPARSRSVVVQFGAELLGERWLLRPELRAVRTLLEQRAPRGVHFTGSGSAAVAGRLHALPELGGLARLLELIALLHALAALPGRAALPLTSEGFRPALNLAQGRRLETVCRFVQRGFRESIRLADVAALAHLTPPAFSRFFKQKTGKPFIDFLTDVRIGEACRLLLEQETLGVSEICYACGFGNLSNFNRHFRLRHGVGPREYRHKFLRTVDGAPAFAD